MIKCLRIVYDKILISMECTSSKWISAAAFCTQHYRERGPYDGVLSSRSNWKGNFHDIQSTWCSAKEGGGCLYIPFGRNPFIWHQPWLPIRTVIYKRKSDDVYIINLKRTWEKLLLAAHAIVAIETWLSSVSYLPGIPTSKSCLSSCCCH